MKSMRTIRLFGFVVASAAALGCADSQGGDGPDPVTLGVIRSVDSERLTDPAEWGDDLDLAIETEFWDLIGNSAHAEYPEWHRKVKAYLEANPDAHPRLALYVSAGAVFALTRLFQSDDIGRDLPEFGEFIEDATTGARAPARALSDREPAVVFYHNNQAMLAFLLRSDADLGVCHLEKLRNVEDDARFVGTEGRAAAPFTYAMVQDEAYVDYAIDMMENCDTAVCMWTSKVSPFKPIGQLLALAEFHAVKAEMTSSATEREAQYDEMHDALDRAAALGAERAYPFLDRIDFIRSELPSRSYTSGFGMGRSPTPIYSDPQNCGGCHIGAIPGTTQEPLDDPYEGADVVTPKPGPPPFMVDGNVDCDL